MYRESSLPVPEGAPIYRRRSLPARDGVAANARLTGGAAVLLLVLLAAEGATIPFVQTLVSPHIFIGLLLVPPVLLKLASTGWRFARYYLGSPSYRRKGPPHPVLRLLAPGVVLSTVALFGSGVALLVAGPGSRALVFLHKASFAAWFVLMGVHVLAHLLELPRLGLPDWRRAGGRQAKLAGGGLRLAALAGSLLAGLALALAAISLAAPWLSASFVGG
jgi:hypothetical protein